jgi:hypothetical protein
MSDLDFLTGRRVASDLDPLYDALALPADRQYGINPGPDNPDAADGVARGYAFNQWMPFTTNRVGSASWVMNGADPQWSTPQVLREGAKGWLDLAQAKNTGNLTPEAISAFMAGSIGAGMAGTPLGALAAGGKRLELPMDAASRLARAQAMGFNVDLPLYHGTSSAVDFGSFRALAPWEAARAGRPPGIWLAEQPPVANRFAEEAARSGLGLSPTFQPRALPQDPAGSRVLPLFARSDSPVDYKLPAKPSWGDVWHDISGLFWDGHDAVRLSNYRMFPQLGPQTIWAIRDPNQLRSWFARFDPNKRSSDDLLAARAVPGFNFVPPPQPGFNVIPPPEPGMRIPIKAGRSAAEMEF